MKNNKKKKNSVTISPTAPPESSVPILPPATGPVSPIKTYSNAEADKAQILSENTNKSGIYKWKKLD